MKHPSKLSLALVVAVALALLPGTMAPAEAEQPSSSPRGMALGHARYVEGMILIKAKKGVVQEKMHAFHAAHGASKGESFNRGRWQVVYLPKGAKVEDFVEKYRKSGLVEYAEPNTILEWCSRSTPDDLYFRNQLLWGLDNYPYISTPHQRDIDAPEGWYLRTDAEDVSVMIVDSGLMWMHEDLCSNMWTNSVEDLNGNGTFEDWWYTDEQNGVYGDLNGIDDDGNLWEDDVIGIDATTGQYDNCWCPWDARGHGTWVAGIAGAQGNNGAGVTGVCWNTRLMAGKCGDDYPNYYDAVKCLNYAMEKGADIVNLSFGGKVYDAETQALQEAIEDCRDPNGDGDLSDGIIVVCAAGNGNAVGYGVWEQNDNDAYPYYPASFEYDNVVTVAGTDQNDQLMNYVLEIVSNYGRTSVDLAAPGYHLWSTGATSPGYVQDSGTSGAAPMVSGALAMLKSHYPSDKYPKTIARLYAGVDHLDSLAGKCVTEGRLNLYGALDYSMGDLHVTPPMGFASKGGEGRPFVPGSKQYKLANYGNASLDWHATPNQNWVSISPSFGTLASYGEITVTVSFTSAADSLGIGSHSAVVSFINDTNGSGSTTRTVDLSIGPVYVKADGGNDGNDGLSWDNAKQTIQAGVDAARNAGMNEVWVAAGSYAPFYLGETHDGMRVYGGFVGNETTRYARPAFPRADATYLATRIDGSTATNTPICVYDCTEPTTRIDGFLITNSQYSGIKSYRSSAVIQNNTIMACWSNGDSGGVYLEDGSPVLLNNRIVGCYANRGAGIYCASTDGGTVIANNTIVGNLSVAGAVDCSAGAGMYFSWATAQAVNNTIAGNKAVGEGCGVAVEYGSVTLVNTIVAFNSSGIYVNGTQMVVRNCDVYGNSGYDYKRQDGTPWNPTGTNGNIQANPMFAGLDSWGDAHIMAGRPYAPTPCVNVGDDSYVQAGWVDMDGQARISGTVDIGADEASGMLPVRPIVRVSPTGDDNNSGTDWASAKRTIQAAIDAIAGIGGQVWVRKGTYLENVRLRPYVYVYGGFNGTETYLSARNWVNYTTTIDGGHNGSVVCAESACNCTLDGFVLRNGSGHKPYSYSSDYCGGGIYCANSFLRLANNTVAGCRGLYGGGIYLRSSLPEIANSTIVGNTAGDGGGIYYESSVPTIINNKIAANSANRGGGVYISGGSGLIANNTVVSNVVPFSESQPSAGGLDLTGGDELLVVANNIVALNSSGILMNWSGNDYSELRYNCVSGNTDYNYYDPYSYDDPTGWRPDPMLDIEEDPKLVSLDYGNLHIHTYSPCRNVGDDTVVGSNWKDIDNQTRILDGRVDIGCDESNQWWGDWTPARYYVSTVGADTNPGTGWGPTTAMRSVQAAMDKAVAVAGAEIWVAQGTYNENITLHPYAYVYGGFMEGICYLRDRKPQVYTTTLNGQTFGSVVTAIAGEGLSRLDGFTITNGTGTTGSNNHKYGGGIYCNYASPTLANNAITANTADHGAGVACISASPVIDANRITGNTTVSYNEGAGIFISEAGAQPMVSNNVIAENNAPNGHGAGICVKQEAGPAIVNNTIVANSSRSGYNSGYVGGIYCDTTGSGPPTTVKNNIIVDNTRYGIARGSGELSLSNNNVYNNEYGNYSGVSAGPGDISQIPGFIDGTAGDYRLLYSSACIDAGDNISAPATDINGCSRPYDGDVDGSAVCDMGAYELGAWIAKYRMSYLHECEVYFGPVSVVGVYPAQGWVYVEALDRTAGIRVNTSQSLSVGDIVTVHGTVKYDSSAKEKYILADTGWPQTTGQTRTLGPLGMRNEWARETSTAWGLLSDGNFQYISTGSLVQTWGRVIDVYAYGGTFTIHDGSKVYLPNSGWTNAQVIVYLPTGGTMPAVGDYVRVSGVITGTTQYSVNLRPRTAADMETITNWDTSSITDLQEGWNYLSVPGIPRYFSAQSVFVGCTPGDPIYLVGNLKRYLAPLQYWDSYGSCWNDYSGGIVVGEGYALNIPANGNTCYAYQRTPVIGDQVLSLPRGSDPMWEKSFIGDPFNENVAWSDCRITDGDRLLTLQEAVNAGWIYKIQKQQGNTETLLDVDISTEYMEARKGYMVYLNRDKLAIIVPDPSP